jgi:hypothetical protein
MSLLTADAVSVRSFIDRYLTDRLLLMNEANRVAVAQAINRFPGGLPANKRDVDLFVSNSIGSWLGSAIAIRATEGSHPTGPSTQRANAVDPTAGR